jgi:hypothetical protein
MLFLAGIALGMVIVFAAVLLNQARVPLRSYEWTLVVAGFLLLLFAVQNYQATRVEHWSLGTPLTFLLTFGLPGIGLIIIAAVSVCWRLFHRRKPTPAIS